MQPLQNSLLDLVADLPCKFNPFRVAPLKLRRVFKWPVLMCPHAEEDGGTVLLCISADCDGTGKVGFSQILR